MVNLTGWRYVAFLSTIVGITGAAIYPIIIQPLMDPTYYRKLIIYDAHLTLNTLIQGIWVIILQQKIFKRKPEPA